jgi:hypothetical protein
MRFQARCGDIAARFHAAAAIRRVAEEFAHLIAAVSLQ